MDASLKMFSLPLKQINGKSLETFKSVVNRYVISADLTVLIALQACDSTTSRL